MPIYFTIQIAFSNSSGLSPSLSQEKIDFPYLSTRGQRITRHDLGSQNNSKSIKNQEPETTLNFLHPSKKRSMEE